MFTGGALPFAAGVAGWVLLSTQVMFVLKYLAAMRSLMLATQAGRGRAMESRCSTTGAARASLGVPSPVAAEANGCEEVAECARGHAMSLALPTRPPPPLCLGSSAPLLHRERAAPPCEPALRRSLSDGSRPSSVAMAEPSVVTVAPRLSTMHDGDAIHQPASLVHAGATPTVHSTSFVRLPSTARGQQLAVESVDGGAAANGRAYNRGGALDAGTADEEEGEEEEADEDGAMRSTSGLDAPTEHPTPRDGGQLEESSTRRLRPSPRSLHCLATVLAKWLRCRCGSRGKSAERLRRRLNYLVRRYGDHAGYWQFVLWSRQALLTVLVIVPSTATNLALRSASARAALLSRSGNGSDTAATDSGSGVDVALEELSNLDGSNTTAAAGGSDVHATDLRLAIFQAAAALAIFALFFGLHRRVHPFAYRFQNVLDGWLFVVDMAIVGLGALYTILIRQSAALMSVFPLEVVLLTLIIGSVAGTAVYLGARACRRARLRAKPPRGLRLSASPPRLQSLSCQSPPPQSRRSQGKHQSFDDGGDAAPAESGREDDYGVLSVRPGSHSLLFPALHHSLRDECSPSTRTAAISVATSMVAMDAAHATRSRRLLSQPAAARRARSSAGQSFRLLRASTLPHERVAVELAELPSPPPVVGEEERRRSNEDSALEECKPDWPVGRPHQKVGAQVSSQI